MKTKTLNRVLSFLMAMCMILSMVPVMASAADANSTVTYTFSDYAAGTQYAEGEKHTLDETVELTINKAHLSTQIRLYAGSNAVLSSELPITMLKVTAGYKAGELSVYTSADGSTFQLVQTISTTTTYTEYTVDVADDTVAIKLEAAGAQIRITNATLTFGEAAADACTHTNTTTTTVDATCTTAGSTTVTCADCSKVISTEEIPALGHTYEGNYCTVCGEEKPAEFVLTDVSQIKSDDVVVIVSTKGTAHYAMSNDKGTGAAPAAVAVDVSNNTVLTDDTTVLWNVSYVSGTLTIYPNGDTSNWLYCTSSNNGVRVGTNENSAFTMDADTGYLMNTATSRFLGVYNNADWRCYTNTTGNTAGQTFGFYVLQTATDTECNHAETTEVAEVPATCTTTGTTAGVICANEECGAVISGCEVIPALGHSWNEGEITTAAGCTTDGVKTFTCGTCGETKTEVIAAIGHAYTDGVCTNCGEDIPASLAGKYYIAAKRSEGNYFYMTSDLGSGDTKRYTAVDSTLAELPAEITRIEDGHVFELIRDDATGLYTICAYGVEAGYLGWSSGNSGLLVAADQAVALTVTAQEDGTYVFYSKANARYLTLNATAGNDYFAFYTSEQANHLSLIPVADSVFECQHTNTTTENVKDATCTESGYTGDVVCSDCGVTITEGTVTEATGHNYADGVCTNCGEEEPVEEQGSYVKATSIAVGDKIIIVSEVPMMELSGFSTTSTVYGVGTAYTDVPAGLMVWTVEAGTEEGSLAFKNEDGNYLYWSSGNSLKSNATKDAQTSWTVSFDGNDVTLVTAGSSDAARHVVWNVGATRFANYKDSTSAGSTSYTAIQFYKFQTGAVCAHSWSDWTVTVQPGCATAGSQTRTCTLCGEVETKEILATGHSYIYGESAITCANGCGYNQAYTLTSLVDARAAAIATGTTASADTYYIKGVVTYINAKNVYIEDATGGFLVYFYNADDAASLALGDEILVWDTVKTYSGLTETSGTGKDEFVKVSSGNALPSQTVTLADLLADTTNEYLCERVVIEGLTVGTINTSGNTALTDANGNTINVHKVSGLAENINEGDIATVTAIVSTYNAYQLLINPGTAATDVVETTAGEETVVTTVTIAEAKVGTVGTYYQVEGVVTLIDGKTVYIQDSTGGIAVYLTAAATCKIGDKVKAYGSLKNYSGLLELDGIDQTNVEFFEILSSDNTVEAQNVTIADLVADTTNEYLAEKITLTGVYVSHYTSYNASYGNVTYHLRTADGSTITIYRAPVASEADLIPGGSIVNVEAVVSAYNGYQLRIVDAASITVTGTCEHTETYIKNATEPTCTEDGYTGTTACVACDNHLSQGETIPALGHNVDNAGVCGTCGNTYLAAVCEGGEIVAWYATVAEAYTASTAGTQYVKLLTNASVALQLDKDLYIDLNGYYMEGTIDAGECKIYAMDSAIEGYGAGAGYIDCSDSSGVSVTVEALFVPASGLTGNADSYMAILGDDGWVIHNIYVGLTHITLKPGTNGIGYKAMFCGDDEVKALLNQDAAFTFTLSLAGGRTVTRSLTAAQLISGKAITVRVDNYDVANHGTTELSATVSLNLASGAKIEGDTYTTTLKTVVEAINANASKLSAEQLAAVATMIQNSAVMQSWEVGNLYTKQEAAA